jgi:hypothetical protein
MEKDNIVQIDSFVPGMKKGKPITLMKGTPNQKTLMLEMPGGKMSAQDLQTIKKAYNLPADISFEQTGELLKKIEASDRQMLLESIDQFDKGTKEYYGELANKTSDVIARDELIKDPMNFYYNQAAKEFTIPNPSSYIPFLGQFLPDDMRLPQDLVSKPSAEMIGGMGAVTAAQSAKILGTRNPFALLTPQELYGSEFMGTMAGGYAYDFGNRILRTLLDLPQPSLKEASSQFLYDTYLNAVFTGGAAAMGPVFNETKGFIGKHIFGINPTKKNLQKLAEITDTYGMPLGIIQATNMPFWRAYSKVIGVLPWVGKEFGRQQQAVQEGSRQYLGKLMNSVAPLQTVSMLGKDLSKMMQDNYESVRNAQRYLYENFEEYAKKLKGKKVISIDRFKALAEETRKAYEEGIPGLQTGETFRYPGSRSQESFGELYRMLGKLQPNITMEQAITLRQMFNDFATNFKTEFKGNIPENQAQAIGNLAAMLELDITNLKNIDNEIDDVVFNTALKKLSAANEYFAATIPNYTGGVASNVKQVNANIFGPGPDQKYGMMYTKEIFDTILQRAKNDPEAMKHLLDLSKATPEQVQAYKKAGNKEGVIVNVETIIKDLDPKSPTYNQMVKRTIPVTSVAPNAGQLRVVRRLLDDALNGSLEKLPVGVTPNQYLNVKSASPELIQKEGLAKAAPEMLEFGQVEFSPQLFAKKLGLDTEDGIEILTEALEGTGVTVDGIKNFLQAADAAGAFIVNDPSTFVTRRITLSGFKGIMLGSAVGAGAGGFVAMNPIMTALMLKYGSKLLTNPKALKAFTEVYTDAVKFPTKDPLTKSRRNDIIQWANEFLPTDEELEEQDFIRDIDKSIISLIQNPQGKLEQNAARDKQIELMTRTPEGLDLETLREIDKRITPDTEEQRFYDVGFDYPDVSLQPNIPGAQLSPQTRSDLAFGTLDEALESQMMRRGIGTL